MLSDEGCPDVNIDVDKYMGWLEENEWVVGMIYVVVGPLIALFGGRLFPWVCATLITVFVLGLFVSMSLAFGWMVTTGGTIGCLAAGLVLGLIAGVLLFKNIRLMVTLLGGIGGFFAGAMIFAVIASSSGWNAVWGWWVISIAFALLGLVLSWKMERGIVLFATAFIGSYLFMRSWTLFFPGHYPSEAEIMSNPEDIEADAIFWVFIGVFAVSFIGSIMFQRTQELHGSLDDYEKA